ncbi:MAG TPA: hemerythrin domain-containing protein [Pirellulales bacterium]|jgi:iron-sulfur cluster repair protein YtfE (RIC family)|nr:hemerythrin domain-containing protein [Pirellulales bacterium]
MLAAQGTLTINAAFLQEIKEENRELRQLLNNCGTALAAEGRTPAEPKRIVELLTKLRDQLAMHFALEEAYGYFDDAAHVTPQLSDRALKLRDEHGDLFLHLGGIVDRAEHMLYHEQPEMRLVNIAEEFTQFQSRFQDHEAQETELVVQVLHDETGCGD